MKKAATLNGLGTASVAKVNAYLRSLGRKEILQAGRGYYYWRGDGPGSFVWPSEYIYRITATEMGYWIRAIERNIKDTK